MKQLLFLFLIMSSVMSSEFYEHSDYDFNTEVDIILVVSVDTVIVKNEYKTFDNGVKVINGTNFTCTYKVEKVLKGEYKDSLYKAEYSEYASLIYDDEGNKIGHESPIYFRSSRLPGRKSGEQYILLIGPIKMEGAILGVGYQGFESIDKLPEIEKALSK